jgi:hypothetical protein
MTLLEPAAPLSLSAAWRRHGSLLLRLCAVPLLTSCKPSEAFLSVYLTQPVADGGKGLTSAQLNEQVWPYDTYGAFVLMLPAGYLAEVRPPACTTSPCATSSTTMQCTTHCSAQYTTPTLHHLARLGPRLPLGDPSRSALPRGDAPDPNLNPNPSPNPDPNPYPNPYPNPDPSPSPDPDPNPSPSPSLSPSPSPSPLALALARALALTLTLTRRRARYSSSARAWAAWQRCR